MRRQPKVLILDEATSALNRRQVQQVFAVVRRLRDEGVAVVFISHRMDEVRDLCDRATIFRDGVNVGTVDVAKARDDEIVRMMIGRTLRETFPPRTQRPDVEEPLLEVRGLNWGDRLRDISLVVHKGEILGLSGLEGQGQGDLLFALFGVYTGVNGDVRVGGKPIRLGGPRDAMAAGLALVPEDRKTQGLILPLPVDENVTLADAAGCLAQRRHLAGGGRRPRRWRCATGWRSAWPVPRSRCASSVAATSRRSPSPSGCSPTPPSISCTIPRAASTSAPNRRSTS